jgi:hypothetical protein
VALRCSTQVEATSNFTVVFNPDAVALENENYYVRQAVDLVYCLELISRRNSNESKELSTKIFCFD